MRLVLGLDDVSYSDTVLLSVLELNLVQVTLLTKRLEDVDGLMLYQLEVSVNVEAAHH